MILQELTEKEVILAALMRIELATARSSISISTGTARFKRWRAMATERARAALTRDLAWSIAQDVANASMRAAGRSKWSQDDYRLAVETFDRLWPEEKDYTTTTVLNRDMYEGWIKP